MGTHVRATTSAPSPTQTDYASLAAFRYALRRFMRFSAAAAQEAGLTPTQHQALLTIKGHPNDKAISVGQLAEHLFVAPHTAAELVMRLEDAGLLDKTPDPNDRRRVGLHLTGKAERALRRLSDIHMQEIREIAPGLIGTLQTLLAGEGDISRQRVAADG